MIKAVIFDLDDTLVSELKFVKSGYAFIAKLLKETYPSHFADIAETEASLLKLFEEDHKNVFNRILANKGLNDERENVLPLVKAYREHFPSISYESDVPETLVALKRKGIKTGILTDGLKETQHRKIEALKAEKDFDIIVITDEFGKDAWKPSPMGFKHIAKALSIDMDEILYVGDNPEKDFYLKKSAGIKTARIIRPEGVYADRPYKEDVREDFRLNSLTDLLEII